LARPLGGGRYPLVTRSQSLETAIDDGAAIGRTAISLLDRISVPERARLAGIQVHQLEGEDPMQLALFNARHETSSRSERLNRALDEVARRFGENAVMRGLVHAERAAPTRRLK